MAFPAGERVTVTRGGLLVVDDLAAFDPAEGRVYLPFGADVRGGDTISIRGLTRTTSLDAQDWRNPWSGWAAGSVVVLDPAPAALPDLGSLFRNTTSAPVLNEDTGVLVFPEDDPIWTGPVKAEAAESQGLTPELGTQRVGIVPFLLTVPLSLVDVKSGDQFRVSQSRDSRLTTRLLTITAVRGSSTSLTRELVAFDNQGGA
jgi:hypothetical protein